MFNLIIKDLLVQKKSILIAMFYILFFIFVFQSLGELMFTSAIVAFTYMLVMGAFAFDDRSRADTVLNSLPIRRRNIVLCKYLALFVFVIIGTITYLLMYNVISSLNLSIKAYPITLKGFIGGILAVSVVNSIYFPLFFKLGYTRAKVINMVLFFSIFFGVPYLVNFITRNMDKATVFSLINFFNKQSDAVIALSLLLLSFGVLLVSYTISVNLYKWREF